MTTHNHPDITGTWVPADGTKSTAELATTSDPNLLALRNSFQPEHVNYFTPQQVRNLAESVTGGPLQKMI